MQGPSVFGPLQLLMDGTSRSAVCQTVQYAPKPMSGRAPPGLNGGLYSTRPRLPSAFSGECGRNEWNMGGAITGDREWMKEETK